MLGNTDLYFRVPGLLASLIVAHHEFRISSLCVNGASFSRQSTIDSSEAERPADTDAATVKIVLYLGHCSRTLAH